MREDKYKTLSINSNEIIIIINNISLTHLFILYVHCGQITTNGFLSLNAFLNIFVVARWSLLKMNHKTYFIGETDLYRGQLHFQVYAEKAP